MIVWNDYYQDVIPLLVSIVGEELITKYLLKYNRSNMNFITYCIRYSRKLELLKYVLDKFEGVKQECIKNINLRWCIIYWLNKNIQRNDIGELIKYLFKELNFTKESLAEIVSYKYPKPDDISNLGKNHEDYWNKEIPQDAIEKLLSMK